MQLTLLRFSNESFVTQSSEFFSLNCFKKSSTFKLQSVVTLFWPAWYEFLFVLKSIDHCIRLFLELTVLLFDFLRLSHTWMLTSPYILHIPLLFTVYMHTYPSKHCKQRKRLQTLFKVVVRVINVKYIQSRKLRKKMNVLSLENILVRIHLLASHTHFNYGLNKKPYPTLVGLEHDENALNVI